MRVVHHLPQAWTPQDIRVAAQMWQRDVIDRFGDDEADWPRGVKNLALVAIAAALHRRIETVHSRYDNYGPSFASRRQLGRLLDRRHVSLDVLAARERRNAALDARDVTAAIMGDPPPGYSALDRMRRQA